MIATLGRHRRVQLWDAATGALVRESAPNDALLWSLAFAPDGESIYLGSMRPGRIERWDARTFTRLWSGAQTSLFQIFAPSADGKRLFAFGASQMLDVIDAATGRVIVSLDTDGYRESKLAASPCGDVVVTMSNRGLRFWETRPWK
jgi:WD40 repeat protein